MASNKTYFWEGSNLALNNSKALLETSIAAYKIEHIGIASSLNILAAEEAIKAMFLYFVFKNVPVDQKLHIGLFKDHKLKHGTLKNVIKSSAKTREIFSSRLKDFQILLATIKLAQTMLHETYTPDQIIEMGKIYGENKVDKIVEAIESLNKWAEENSKLTLDITGICKWLDKANDRKNDGLYVGIINNNWKSPHQMSEKNYLIEKGYTEQIIQYVESYFFMTNYEQKVAEIKQS